jgi:hypothetical protein
MASLPDFMLLHERHYALTQPVCEYLAEAASVCLSRHHAPPLTLRVHYGAVAGWAVSWEQPDHRQLAAHRNVNDATENGACAVAIAVLEATLNLFTISRADTLTGADYFVAADRDCPDLEGAHRLEVSGTDLGTVTQLKHRLKRKIAQLKAACGDDEAFATVVAFHEATVVVQKT